VACDTALDVVPDCVEVIEALLALALQEPGLVSVDRVDQVVKKLLLAAPESSIAAATIGASLVGSMVPTEVEEGQALLESAVATDKTCLPSLCGLAALCGRTREDQKCLEFTAATMAAVKSLEILRGNKFWTPLVYDALLLEGMARSRLPGMLSQAAAAFGEASKLDPLRGPPLAGLAEVALAEGKLDQAEGLCDKALVVDPDCASAMSALGWVHFGRGKLDRAETLIQRAIAIDAAQAVHR
jgi:tetratricopeptide (TPR) repeat protein